jgi:hypothetical protein
LDLVKQYIIQCIVAAANNLRLSSEKIETVAIIRERLGSAENLTDEVKNFKKITELSKLGIKLSELQAFIDNGKIDFLKLSDKFKEHSYGLVRELNSVLDVLTPQAAYSLFKKFEEDSIKTDSAKKAEIAPNPPFQIKKEPPIEYELPKRSHTDQLKESIIFEELNKESAFDFENYEGKVLRPIKELDSFLTRVLKYEYAENEMNSKIKLMKENAELSQKIGFEILSNMHSIFAQGLELINKKKISPSINIIESLRACLIVIVSVVRGKEVDITNYLNRAENFGKTLLSKQREK